MYRIKFTRDSGLYQIHSKHFGAFEGDLNSITKKAIEIGLSQDEITTAYEVMAKNRDTIAEFGINGNFMFSRKEAC